jgi:hypothetical protein
MRRRPPETGYAPANAGPDEMTAPGTPDGPHLADGDGDGDGDGSEPGAEANGQSPES